jgi:hypothetical protein
MLQVLSYLPGFDTVPSAWITPHSLYSFTLVVHITAEMYVSGKTFMTPGWVTL